MCFMLLIVNKQTQSYENIAMLANSESSLALLADSPVSALCVFLLWEDTSKSSQRGVVQHGLIHLTSSKDSSEFFADSFRYLILEEYLSRGVKLGRS